MDSQAYPQVLLVALAFYGRPEASVAIAGVERAVAEKLKVAHSSKGAWHIARIGSLHTALSEAHLRRSGFILPSDLAAQRPLFS